MTASRALFVTTLLWHAIVNSGNENTTIDIRLAIDSVKSEEYYCTSVPLPSQETLYITEFHPTIKADIAHHVLLFGCSNVREENAKLKYWNCASYLCDGDVIIYAWARDAPGLTLPQGVGFKVGHDTSIHYVVMQVHFHKEPYYEEDYPSLSLSLVESPQGYVAGIYLLGGFNKGLQPGKDDINVDVACTFDGPNPIHLIAFRTHAHSRSPLIEGYLVSSDDWTLIGKHSPQDPQAFYPVDQDDIVVSKGDILAARCHYNTTGYTQVIKFGSHSMDEMCNMYIMYYTNNNGMVLDNPECWSKAPSYLSFPTPSVVNTTAGPISHVSYDVTLAIDWVLNGVSGEALQAALGGIKIGQISGISVTNDSVYILHRGAHVWDFSSFDSQYRYTLQSTTAIEQPIVRLSSTGGLVSSMGSGVFYLPHGLAVDDGGVLWITDVARHQVFKVLPGERINVLGDKFVPGHDGTHFCQPTDIAVDTSTGHFYVADGYCNHRIVEYQLNGTYVRSFSSMVEGVELNVPHSLALNGDMLYVADRENGRIVCYNTSTGVGVVFVDRGPLGDTVYAITFSSPEGAWPMFAVNGSGSYKGKGFTIDRRGSVVNQWGPPKGFTSPHDISADGNAVYVSEIGPNRVWKFLMSRGTDVVDDVSGGTDVVGDVLGGTDVVDDVSGGTDVVGDISGGTDVVSDPTESGGEVADVSIAQIMTTSIIKPMPTETSNHVTSDTIVTLSSSNAALSTPTNNDEYVCPSRASRSVTMTTCSNIYSSQPAASDNSDVLVMLGVPLGVGVVMLVLLLVLCGCVIRHAVRGSTKPILVHRHYSINPKKKLETLLRPGNKGFTKVRTYDSDSGGDDEFTVFEKA